MTDKTALSYWFPKLEAAGIRVPLTVIIPMPLPAQEDLWGAFDGMAAKNDALPPFYEAIDRAAQRFGYPVFLRTDHTSAKHEWKDTCFLAKKEDIPRHVMAIVEYSEMAGMIGLPWQVWAVREMLPTMPVATAPRYGDMPINREFRFFVDDGAVRCFHPYWPDRAIEAGGARGVNYAAITASLPDGAGLMDLASAAGKAVGGSWSIDILETRQGWFVTDMAEAHKSFHWEGCPHG